MTATNSVTNYVPTLGYSVTGWSWDHPSGGYDRYILEVCKFLPLKNLAHLRLTNKRFCKLVDMSENYLPEDLKIKKLCKACLDLGKQIKLEPQNRDLSTQFNQAQKLYKQLRNIRTTDIIIFSLFGGQASFEALPNLDISAIDQRRDYIDYIEPDQMTAPIMRGVDAFGRVFFTLRARHRHWDDVKCQTFFRRFNDGSSWSDGGYHIIDSSGHFIDGVKVKEEVYQKLKELIENRRNANYKLV
jgi:hypothetical protein